jgi:hypothetical protein
MIPKEVIEDFQSEISEFKREINTFSKDLDNVINDGLKESGKELKGRIVTKVEKEFDTNTDRNTTSLTNWKNVGYPSVNEREIYTKAPHARAMEYGASYTIPESPTGVSFVWEDPPPDAPPATDVSRSSDNLRESTLKDKAGEYSDKHYFPQVERERKPNLFLDSVWNKYNHQENKVVSNIGDELQDSIERNFNG